MAVLVAIRESQRGGFLQILDLLLPLQCLDESFLRQVLRVVHVSDDPVDLQEDAAQVLLNEALLRLPSSEKSRRPGSPEYLAASLMLPPGRDWPAVVIVLRTTDERMAKTCRRSLLLAALS